MKQMLLWTAAALCGTVLWADERELVRGEEATLSPDGRHLLFQRAKDEDFDVGIKDLKSGGVIWVSQGPGHATYPAWAPDGSVLFTYEHETETARAAWQKKVTTGWNLYRWKDGATEQVTKGRFFDFAASVDARGDVWFASNRCAPRHFWDCHLRVGVYRLRADGEPEEVVVPRSTWSGAAISPRVSPNGKILVWAASSGYTDSFSLFAAALRADGKTGVPMAVSPAEMYAHSPNWRADGKYLVCGGFRAGDPGWGVYVIEPRAGAVRRIADGRNPSFSPDGKYVIYDRDAVVYAYRIENGDLPPLPAASVVATIPPEKVVAQMESPKPGDSVPLPAEAAFGTDEFWVKVKFKLGKDNAENRLLLLGQYADAHTSGFEIYFPAGKNEPVLAVRDKNGAQLPLSRKGYLTPGLVHELTLIRRGKSIYVSMDGCPPDSVTYPNEPMDYRTPQKMYVGKSFTGEVLSASCGSGRPEAFKDALTREELFK